MRTFISSEWESGRQNHHHNHRDRGRDHDHGQLFESQEQIVDNKLTDTSLDRGTCL